MMSMAPPGIRLGCRTIRVGDEDLLLPEEQRVVTTRDLEARRASGAARHLARGLMAELGHPVVAIGRERFGQPVWPAGVVGSLAHDRVMAVAAVVSSSTAVSLGIDVEPAEPLPDDAVPLVMTADDEPGTASRHLAGRILFAAKEAIYKAVHPLDGIILNHDDVIVSLSASCGRTRTGAMVRLYWCISPRIVVLAVNRRQL
ncbi:MAG: 4'-phosphopantetheinyl transferase superfamily protein [Pseudolabrys sp.]|nr:4'-phosphopantetheinyl transferase superfamily protein [Pseudolabrys sp.]